MNFGKLFARGGAGPQSPKSPTSPSTPHDGVGDEIQLSADLAGFGSVHQVAEDSPKSAKKGKFANLRSGLTGLVGRAKASARSPGASGRSKSKTSNRKKLMEKLKETTEDAGSLQAKALFRLGQLKEKAASKVSTLRDTRAALLRGDQWGSIGNRNAHLYVDEDAHRNFKDVAEELGLSADPVVEEIGEERLLEWKHAGALDPTNDDQIMAFKKHKATLGKALFEAENSNNQGVEFFAMGDYTTARAYFDHALELASEKKKPAAKELITLKNFVNSRYDGSEAQFYTQLVQGEWRSALGRKHFVESLNKLGYPGDADRVFSMLDSVANDGKVSLPELTSTLKAKTVRLNNMDREPAQVGVILSNIACCMLQQGDYMNAMQKLRNASRIVRRWAPTGTAGDTNNLVLRVSTNIIIGYIRLMDLDAALHNLAGILEKRESVLGPYHEEVLQCLYLVGYCLLLKANRFHIVHDRQRMDSKKQELPVETNYKYALCSFKERLRRQQQIIANMPPKGSAFDDVGARNAVEVEIARSHEIIAEIHDKCGDLQRAYKHLIQSRELKGANLDDTDPDMFTCLNILSSVCSRAGKHEEALEILQAASNATEELLGEHSLAMATQSYHLGLTYFRLGSQEQDKSSKLHTFASAIEKLKICLDIRMDLLGPESEHVATCAHLMGSVYLASGDRQDARRKLEQALLTRIAALGKNHPATACSAHALGCLYSRTPRRMDEAVLLLRKAVATREKRLGEDSLSLADSLHELGSVLLRRGGKADLEPALHSLAKSASIREQTLGKKHLSYAASLHQLGQAHLHIKLFEEAKLYLSGALAIRERLAGKHSVQTSGTRQALGIAYASLGQLDMSLKMIKMAYKDRERIFGMENVLSADSLHQVGLVLIKGNQLDEALAPLHQALKLRMRLNQEDLQQRLEDSDEDPKDLVKKDCGRNKRVRKRRETKRREEEKKKKKEASKAKVSKGGNLVEGPMSHSETEDESARPPPDVGVGEAGFDQMLAAALEEEKKKTRRNKRRDDDADSVNSGSPKSGSPAGSSSPNPRSPTNMMMEDMTQPTGRRRVNNPKGAGNDEANAQNDGGAADVLARKKTVEEMRKQGNGDIDPVTGVPLNLKGEDGDEDSSEVILDEVGVDVRGFLAPTIATAMQTLANVYVALKDFDKAKFWLDRSGCIREELFGSLSAEFGETMHHFGQLNRKLQRPHKALRYFRKALKAREKACGHMSEQTAATCIQLAEVLQDINVKDEANIFMSRALAIKENLHGEKHVETMKVREKWDGLAANGMEFDPVEAGETIPHISKRSAESFLHGWKDRQEAERNKNISRGIEDSLV
eukprot:TRINITY_DN35834_c0_g1_i1.p1 TRINITY_DN35834_c0_g1~~TRINITY_DN35834_c0_g1_i1.p1  ORF type:complete len:1334 (+),score=318.69 TRINITY_DN35834_c0_g1_i1:154-4155(+)